MLAIEPVREGRVYHWSIAQLMERESTDTELFLDWIDLLAAKRRDYWYPEVLEAIRINGFVRPLNADVEKGQLQLSDGHHRLAAAIDLNMEAVPVIVYDYPLISADSGCWNGGDAVAMIGDDVALGGW